MPTGPLDLTGTTWLLIKYLSPDGAAFTVPVAVTPTAAFTADQMSGNAGCNTFNGPYALGAGNAKDGQDLKLGPLVSTKMACQDPMATVESAYLGRPRRREQGVDPRHRQPAAVGRGGEDHAGLRQGELTARRGRGGCPGEGRSAGRVPAGT